MNDTQFERFITALERIANTLASIDDTVSAIHDCALDLIAHAEDGGAYVRVEVLESEDEDEE